MTSSARFLRPLARHSSHQLGHHYDTTSRRSTHQYCPPVASSTVKEVAEWTLTSKRPYEASRHDLNSPVRRSKALAKLRAKAQNLGFQLVELQPAN